VNAQYPDIAVAVEGERFPPLGAAQADGEIRTILQRLEATGEVPRGLRQLAHATNCFKPFVMMARALRTTSDLPADVQECMVLFLSADWGLPGALAEHRVFAATAGLSAEQMDAAERGVKDRPLTKGQQLGVELCQVLRADRRVSDKLWGAIVAEWGRAGAIDAVFSVAYWGGMIPLLLRGLDIEPGAPADDEGSVSDGPAWG
jgi:hypothetical protein